MTETTKEGLKLLIKEAVGEALKVPDQDLTCPDCATSFKKVPEYLDHRVAEYMGKSLEDLKAQVEAVKIPSAEEFLGECKDGLCKIIEETYNVARKDAPPVEPVEEVIPGLFDHHDAEVEELEKLEG